MTCLTGWIIRHELWLKKKWPQLLEHCLGSGSRSRLLAGAMASRAPSDAQWSGHGGWWTWRDWDRWSGDQAHVEAAGNPSNRLDTMDGMENLASHGQGVSNTAEASILAGSKNAPVQFLSPNAFCRLGRFTGAFSSLGPQSLLKFPLRCISPGSKNAPGQFCQPKCFLEVGKLPRCIFLAA